MDEKVKLQTKMFKCKTSYKSNHKDSATIQWLGHEARIKEEILIKQCLTSEVRAKRSRGRSRTT